MNDSLFQELELSPREIKVYRFLLKSGSGNPVEIAKSAGIKRTTAYSLARGLVERGFLHEDASKRPRIFSLASPKEVRSIISEERDRLNEREAIYKRLADELSRSESAKTYPVPEVRFVEETKIRHFLLNEDAKWNDSMLKTDPTWWGFQDHSYVELFSDVIEAYWRRAPAQIILKLLSNSVDAAREARMRRKYPKREIKFWDKASDFITTTWIVGDYVVMVNTRRKPFYLVEIHDATFAHDQREIFRNLWPLV